jgi:hypothetical protein
MSDEIAPALTPEEWTPCYGAAGYLGADVDSSEEAIQAGGAQRWTGGLLTFNNEYTINKPHAVAALCLHGQPFGFTQAHVTALRRYLGLVPERPDWNDNHLATEAIDRIAALLPPAPK